MTEWNAFAHAAENNPPEKSKGWRSYYESIGSFDVHTIPIDDDMEHEASVLCECKPKLDQLTNEAGEITARNHIHNAWDGRKGPNT